MVNAMKYLTTIALATIMLFSFNIVNANSNMETNCKVGATVVSDSMDMRQRGVEEFDAIKYYVTSLYMGGITDEEYLKAIGRLVKIAYALPMLEDNGRLVSPDKLYREYMDNCMKDN